MSPDFKHSMVVVSISSWGRGSPFQSGTVFGKNYIICLYCVLQDGVSNRSFFFFFSSIWCVMVFAFYLSLGGKSLMEFIKKTSPPGLSYGVVLVLAIPGSPWWCWCRMFGSSSSKAILTLCVWPYEFSMALSSIIYYITMGPQLWLHTIGPSELSTGFISDLMISREGWSSLYGSQILAAYSRILHIKISHNWLPFTFLKRGREYQNSRQEVIPSPRWMERALTQCRVMQVILCQNHNQQKTKFQK